MVQKMVQKLVQESNGLGVHWSSPILPYACYLNFIDARPSTLIPPSWLNLVLLFLYYTLFTLLQY